VRVTPGAAARKQQARVRQSAIAVPIAIPDRKRRTKPKSAAVRIAHVPNVPVATRKMVQNANPVNQRGSNGGFDCDWIHRAPVDRADQSGGPAGRPIETYSRSSAGSMPTVTIS
jgi:hypothetical protein